MERSKLWDEEIKKQLGKIKHNTIQTRLDLLRPGGNIKDDKNNAIFPPMILLIFHQIFHQIFCQIFLFDRSSLPNLLYTFPSSLPFPTAPPFPTTSPFPSIPPFPLFTSPSVAPLTPSPSPLPDTTQPLLKKPSFLILTRK